MMELAINEVKTQAKKLLKALNENPYLVNLMNQPLKRSSASSISQLKLKHCLFIVSQQLGFDNWQHAHEVLSGNKTSTPFKMGSFFYPKSCYAFINEWFTNYQQAKSILMENEQSKWLLPYKNQYLIVKSDYIKMFKLDEVTSSLWLETSHDMVQSYNTIAWDKITSEIIKHRVKNF